MYPPAGPNTLVTTSFACLGIIAPFMDDPRAGKEALCEMTLGFFTFVLATGALPFDALVVFLAPLASLDPPFLQKKHSLSVTEHCSSMRGYRNRDSGYLAWGEGEGQLAVSAGTETP
jgi:hypothetical protein